LYNNRPIKYEYDLSKYSGKRSETNIHNMTCHFINKNRVLILLEEHTNRIDCVFTNTFDFGSLEDNSIYIPAGYDHVNNGINDQIAYGKMDVMKKYNSINAVDLLEKKLSIPHPESINCANIRYYGLNIKSPRIIYYIDR